MKPALVRIGALSFVVATPFPAIAQTSSERDWMWHMNWGWGHMIFGTLTMLAFWGGLIVLVVFLVRWLGGGSNFRQDPPTSRRTAIEILQERFAKGEIDKQEYEEKRRLLKDQG
jgi:putative membrane protein